MRGCGGGPRVQIRLESVPLSGANVVDSHGHDHGHDDPNVVIIIIIILITVSIISTITIVSSMKGGTSYHAEF